MEFFQYFDNLPDASNQKLGLKQVFIVLNCIKAEILPDASNQKLGLKPKEEQQFRDQQLDFQMHPTRN